MVTFLLANFASNRQTMYSFKNHHQTWNTGARSDSVFALNHFCAKSRPNKNTRFDLQTVLTLCSPLLLYGTQLAYRPKASCARPG